LVGVRRLAADLLEQFRKQASRRRVSRRPSLQADSHRQGDRFQLGEYVSQSRLRCELALQ